MASLLNLTYKNLLSTFFVDDKLINQRSNRIEKGFQFVLDNVPIRDLSKKLQDIIKKKVASVEVTFFKKWRESKSKSKVEFEHQYEKWIHTELKLPPSITSVNNRMRGSTQKKKIFGELSERQKIRRVEELDTFEVGQLLLAAAKAAKHSNQVDLEYVLNLLYKDNEKATEIRSLLKAEQQKSRKVEGQTKSNNK